MFKVLLFHVKLFYITFIECYVTINRFHDTHFHAGETTWEKPRHLHEKSPQNSPNKKMSSKGGESTDDLKLLENMRELAAAKMVALR